MGPSQCIGSLTPRTGSKPIRRSGQSCRCAVRSVQFPRASGLKPRRARRPRTGPPLASHPGDRRACLATGPLRAGNLEAGAPTKDAELHAFTECVPSLTTFLHVGIDASAHRTAVGRRAKGSSNATANTGSPSLPGTGGRPCGSFRPLDDCNAGPLLGLSRAPRPSAHCDEGRTGIGNLVEELIGSGPSRYSADTCLHREPRPRDLCRIGLRNEFGCPTIERYLCQRPDYQ